MTTILMPQTTVQPTHPMPKPTPKRKKVSGDLRFWIGFQKATGCTRSPSPLYFETNVGAMEAKIEHLKRSKFPKVDF
jgi:hypothetical protein